MTRLSRVLTILSLLLAVAAPQAAAAQAVTPREETPADYPDGPGRDQTFYTCTACHGFKLVAAQGQARGQWEDTLDFMTTRHSMPKLEGNDRRIVLDYLEVSFPPRRTPGGFQNPFLKK